LLDLLGLQLLSINGENDRRVRIRLTKAALGATAAKALFVRSADFCGSRGEGLERAHSVEKLTDFGALSQAIALISFGCARLDGSSSFGWYHGLEFGHFSEVLDGGGESEFILNATGPS